MKSSHAYSFPFESSQFWLCEISFVSTLIISQCPYRRPIAISVVYCKTVLVRMCPAFFMSILASHSLKPYAAVVKLTWKHNTLWAVNNEAQPLQTSLSWRLLWYICW